MKTKDFPRNPYPEFNVRRDWENQSVTQINRETQHAPWGAYTTVEQALACDREASPRVMSLDGVWRFTLADRPANVPAGFWSDGFDASSWATIQVPGNWELQGFGKPIYTNHIMPWPIDIDAPYLVKPMLKGQWNGEEHLRLNPPQVPEDNPTGCYVRSFDLPADWAGLDVHLWFGGVEAAMHLWVNGQPVGYSQDSKLPCDFDVTRFLRPGANTVALQVERWSDGTWLEDQDYWYLSGIFRSVRLVAKNPIHIRDWFVKATPDVYGDGATWRGEILLQQLDGYADHTVKVELFDAAGKQVAATEAKLNRWSWYSNHVSGNAFRFEAHVDSVARWTPETPTLYTTVITLLDADGKVVDIESSRTGFRRIEIGPDHVIRLNGVRMIFRGTNRHEHALRYGRAVTKDHMRREIIQMKQLNFNAVRTCHYPDSPEWYDLCDEMGICLVCEADLETHALGGLASTDPSWAYAYLERAIRMVLVHKNHPAIVSWSMGNESLCGPNHAAMSNWIRDYDDTRLVQYESGGPTKLVSDIRGNMYAHPEYIKRMLGDAKDLRPVVLVEYLYQIRNSGGGMYIFPQLIEDFERFQGGFVWDWQDKCLVAKDPATGEEFPGFGGDFDEPYKERVCPYHMTCNGVVLPDITPKPVALEVKEAQAPLRVVAENDDNARAGRFILRNRHHATCSKGFVLRAIAKVDGVETVSRVIPTPAAAPMADARFDVDLKEFFPERPAGSELHLDFVVTLAADTAWAKAGHEISHTQFAIPSPAVAYAAKPACTSAAKAALAETADEIRVDAGSLSLVFDRHGGILSSAAFDGAPVIAEGPRVNLARPRCGLDTDAMTHWGFDGIWQRALEGLERHSSGARASALSDGSVLVETDETLVAPDGTQVASAIGSYRVSPCGELVVGTALDVSRAMQHVPRVGLSLVLPEGFENLEWFGRGPGECYCDRMEHTPVGLYRATVADQHFPFVPPAECGGHEDTRWLKVSNAAGVTLRVCAPFHFHFDAHHASVRDYQLAEHDHQLPRRPETFLNIDHRHAGIGGNMAWSTIIDEKHLVPAAGYSFRFVFGFSK